MRSRDRPVSHLLHGVLGDEADLFVIIDDQDGLRLSRIRCRSLKSAPELFLGLPFQHRSKRDVPFSATVGRRQFAEARMAGGANDGQILG